MLTRTGAGGASGGQPEYILPLARAALATGSVSGILMEVHPDPARALSDAQSQLALEDFPAFIPQLLDVYATAQKLAEDW